MNPKYAEGDHVTAINLGPSYADKKYRGIIRGIAVEGITRIYILEMIDKFDPEIYPYSNVTLTESCLQKDW
jgi:hypothetical protein